jgi:CheY-like chemotaxis protein
LRHLAGIALRGATVDEMPDGTSKLRVLVVDDSIDAAQTLSMLLEAMGCATSVAFDGRQALDAAAGFEPHLAIIDLEMPGMTGCEVVRRLRSNHPDRISWNVCLTGRGRPDDERQCMEAGFDAFQRKPISDSALSDVLRMAEKLRRDDV